ncbi:MAG: VCBS repeat-containing protein [Bacteroidetes bacterium]|nr:VCBS repeat-containing protein [Bacteroidota bacterium]
MVRAYINGNLIQSVTMATAVSANFTAAEIGAWTTQRYFAGIMDEYRIWNMERTLTEITNSMFSTLTGTESGLLASFSFNQGIAGGTNTGINTLVNAKGSNNGTLTNFALAGASSNWVSGTVPSSIADNCLNFNGTNNWVSCGSVNPVKFTIEAWALPTSVSADQAVVSTLYTGTNSGAELHIGSDSYPYVTIRNGAAWLDIKGPAKVVAGVWIHLAATFDGSTCNLFVNGIKVATQTSISYNAGTSTLLIGVRMGPGLYFSGKIDDVRIWNRAITETNLLDSLYKVLNGSEKGLLAHYGFNQGTASGTNTGLTTLLSSTGTNHGTLTNFALSGSASNWVTAFLPSPASHVTNFAASLVSNKMTLTWTDATGSVIPDGYLIYASKTNAFTNPVDGILPADDNDLNDGTGTIRVAKGIQTYNGWINEDFNKIYYFKIIPLTTPGINVKYYTSGTIPQVQVTSKPLFIPVTSTLPNHFYPTWGDYNNDGYLDLLLEVDGSSSPYKHDLYKNNRNNTYTSVMIFPTDELRWIDIDCNGYLDVTGKSNIYYNNGGTSFTTVASSTLGLSNATGEWADLDKDGDLDLMRTPANMDDVDWNYIKIYRRDGSIFNELHGNSFHPCQGLRKWFDYNKDGYPDILTSGLNPIDGKIYTIVYKNEGNEKFTEQPQLVLPVLKLGSVSIADLNSDGWLDLVFVGETGEAIVSVNNQGSNFTNTTISTLSNPNSTQVQIADFTNDGLNDILVNWISYTYGGTFKIFRNDGNGSFSELFSSYATTFVSIADINNDGNIDVAQFANDIYQNTSTSQNLSPNKISNASAALEGNGIRFSWSATDDKTPAAGLTYNLRIGTSTGTTNILSPNANIPSGTIKMLAEGNMGSLTTPFLKLPKGTYYWSVQAVDNSFRGGTFSDEKSITIIDVPASNITAEKIDNNSLKLNWTNGNGARRAVFCKTGTTGTAGPVNRSSYLASSDFAEGNQIGSTGWYCVYNGTGDSVTVSNLNSSDSYIFHVVEYSGNSGSETYILTTANGNPGDFSTGIISEQPAIFYPNNRSTPTIGYFGDFNNDNYIDFLFGSGKSGIQKIFYNQRNKTFSSTDITVSIPIFRKPLDIVIDYNNDGWFDYFETGDTDKYYSYPTFTRVFTNRGDNTFSEKKFNSDVEGTIYSSIAMSDYNNDGNLDLFIGGDKGTVPVDCVPPCYRTTYERISKVYKSNGAAGNYSFTEQTDIVLPKLSKGAAKWGDFNNDGWSDLIITGQANNGLYYIYLNVNNKNNSFTTTEIESDNNEQDIGYLECGDFDKDGYLDFIYASDSSGTNGKARLYWNNRDNTFTRDLITFADQTSLNQFAIGDFDNDQALDVIFAMGNTPYKRLYKNNYPIRSFSLVTELISPAPPHGVVKLADYDNDGDQDILSTDGGVFPTGLCNMVKNNSIMKSTAILANNPPASPGNIRTELSPGQLLISWDKVTSDETPNLSYNLKLEKGGVTINSPASDLSTGKRRIPEMGNTGMNNFAVMKGLPVGTYSISVQAVDGAFTGGAWSAPVVVELKNTKAFFTFDTVCYKVATKLSDLSTSTKNIAGRKWKYNNSVISTDSVAHFVFPHSGTDNITLVITDGEGTTDSITHSIKIKERPTASYSATTVCLGTTTTFVNNSSRNGSGTVTWNWNYDNGDPASADSIPLNKVFGLAKTYNTRLIVTASNGCADTLAKEVIVGAFPNTLTSVNGKTVFCQGDSLILSVENNPLYNYQWKLDNNDLTNSNANSHTVKSNSGGYSVKITNPLANCVASSAQTIVTVDPKPAAPFISESGSIQFCQGDSVLLTAGNNTGYDFHWKLNDGEAGSGSNQFVAKNGGTYSLLVTNSKGCSANSTNNVIVTVNTKPVLPTVNISGPTTFCEGSSVDLSVGSVSGYTYQWENNGSGITGATNSSIVVQTQGVYNLKISNSFGCYIKTENTTVNVLTTPGTPTIQESGPLTFCEGSSVILSVNQTSGYSYQWKLNGGEVGSNSNQYMAKSSGRYSLVVSNSNCSVTSANIVDITVNPLPVVSDINLVGSDKFCKGGKATLSVPLNSNYTYSWKNGTNDLQLNTNSIDAAESGEYYVEVSLAECKVTSAPRRIEVVEKPARPDIDKGSYFADKCLNENPLILSVDNMVSGYSYQWYKNETPISNSSSIEVMESGNYYLEAVVDICPSERALAEIKLKNPLAKPDIFAKGPAVWIVSTTSDAKYYNWYYNGSIVQRDNKNVFVAGQKMGLYRVSISNDNDCFVFSNTIEVPTGITGIEDPDPFEGVKIYPNPTTGLFTIDMDNNIFGELSINIFSQTGSKVLSIKFDKTTEHFSSEIDLSGQSKGLYLINLSLDKFRAVRKVLVE